MYKSKSKDKEKKLSQLEDVLRKNVKELKTVMLEGIKDQIYEENCDTKLEKVVDAGNKHFLDVYKSVYHTIENTEGVSLEQYKVEVKRAQAVIKSKSAPRQITSDPVDLLKHALITAPLYEKVVKDLLKDMEKNGTIRAEEVKFSCAPVKKLQRVTEKSMLKAKTPGDASKTLDLVRGMVICSDIPVITKMVAALTDLCSNGKIERVRLKDRFNNPSAGGWRDYMDNFMICGDKNKHICELQIVHKVMITARKGLPGHVVYGKVRNAMELSFLYVFVCSPLLIYNYILTQTLHTGIAEAQTQTRSVRCFGAQNNTPHWQDSLSSVTEDNGTRNRNKDGARHMI